MASTVKAKTVEMKTEETSFGKTHGTGFKKYISINNPNHILGKAVYCGLTKGEFYAYEKIDGSNYQFIYDVLDCTIKTASRTQLVDDDTKFMNHWRVRDRYIDSVRGMFDFIAETHEDVGRINLYGELFGGTGYGDLLPHPDSVKVQKNIFYCEDNDFVAFDIYLTKIGEEKGRWLDMDLMEKYCDSFKIPVLKPLHKRDFDAMVALSPDFISTVATTYYGYKQLSGNYAEGYVIKPAITKHFPCGSRFVWKHKSDRYSEVKKRPPMTIKKKELSNEHKKLVDEATNYITKARLSNVMGKMTEDDKKNHRKVIGLLIADALKDFKKDYKLNNGSELPKKEQKFVAGEMSIYASIEEYD